MKPWKVLSSEDLFTTPIIKLRVEKCELPDSRVMSKYYILDFPDWVYVLPVTSDGQILLLKQYRHAARDFFWEIPGGTMDPRNSEEILEAAQRELMEETGYTSKNWKKLASLYPNPALQSNQIHMFLALDCVATHEQNLDPFEELEVHPCSMDETFRKLDANEITHSLMVAALSQARPFLQKNFG